MNYPNGFFRAITASGKDGGLGFHCERCHYVIPHHVPRAVRHCGRVDEFKEPGLLARMFRALPVVRLGYRSQASSTEWTTVVTR